jgi:putative oxidoreductase
MSTRLVFPALGGLYRALSGLAYPLIRVVAGLFLMPHGARKIFGWFGGSPEGTAALFSKLGIEPALPLVYLSGGIEFFGGLLLVLGLWTRPAALAVIIVLGVAIERVHLAHGFFIFNSGYEHALLWLLIVLAILMMGGGRLSLDAARGKEF